MLSSLVNELCKLRNLLVESFDIFGQQPTMRILQQKKFTSGIGCCMTILISTITMTYLITQILTLQDKSQPKLVISEEQIFDSTAFPLYNENFTLAVSVGSVNSLPVKGQNKYYNITVNHCLRQRILNEKTNTLQVTENCTQLPIAPCQQSDFDHELQQNFFKTARLGVMQCIDREYLRNNPPALQGQFSGKVYQYIAIFMRVCQNSSTYQDCAPIEEIQSVLSAGHYTVYASDYLLQFNEPNEPYQQFINMDFITFSVSSSKTLLWNYRIQETHTDDGYFLENDNLFMNIRKQSMREETDFYNNQYLVCHYIQLDYVKTINQRSYIKMQTILSQVGGFWQVLIVIISLMINPLVNGLMMIQMANELYRFNQSEKQKQEHQIRIDTLGQQEEYSLNPHQQEKDENLSNTFLESLFLLLGCNKKKMKVFQKAKFDIMEKLDIARVIQKIQEIDMLKYILLSDEQYKLFEILPKPLINEENFQTQFKMSEDDINFCQLTSRKSGRRRNTKKSIQDYVLSFQQVSKQQSRVSVDEKLLQMMDKNILSIFESYQRKIIRKHPDRVESEPQIQKPK